MNIWILGGMALAVIFFIWVWIGLVMVHHFSIARRMEKLLNIENPLPEEEKELAMLKDQRTVEGTKLRSAKWTLGLFMLFIVASIVLMVVSEPTRVLLGIETVMEAIWIGVVVLGFFCLPTYMGLVLASFSTKNMEKKRERRSQESAA